MTTAIKKSTTVKNTSVKKTMSVKKAAPAKKVAPLALKDTPAACEAIMKTVKGVVSLQENASKNFERLLILVSDQSHRINELRQMVDDLTAVQSPEEKKKLQTLQANRERRRNKRAAEAEKQANGLKTTIEGKTPVKTTVTVVAKAAPISASKNLKLEGKAKPVTPKKAPAKKTATK